MGNKIMVVLAIVYTIMIIGGIIIYRIVFNNPLLSESIDQIEKVVIELQRNPEMYDGTFIVKELSLEKDKIQIERLYNEIKKTKIKNYPFDDESMQNDKYFIIKFIYKNKKIDEILPSETCIMIYKEYVNSSGWSGGVNENVVKIVEEIRRSK